MGDISAHFSKYEAKCKCGCGQCLTPPAQVKMLEQIREVVNQPVHVTSWNRCVIYNKKVGGASKSQHLTGTGTDIKVEGITTKALAKIAEKCGARGIGIYHDFLHVDTRANIARWEGK